MENLLFKLEKTYKEQSRSELEKMLVLKQEDGPGTTGVYPWDFPYYDRLLKEKNSLKSQLSNEEIRKYFSVKGVVLGMLSYAANNHWSSVSQHIR